MEALAENRCQWVVRISLSTGRLAQRVSLPGGALQKEPQGQGRGHARAIPVFGIEHYSYRVFVNNMKDPIDLLVWFYGQRGGAENLIKEANNDAGLAAHPSGRWMMNCNHFQLAMLAYNLNCWLMLMLFNREEEAKVEL